MPWEVEPFRDPRGKCWGGALQVSNWGSSPGASEAPWPSMSRPPLNVEASIITSIDFMVP